MTRRWVPASVFAVARAPRYTLPSPGVYHVTSRGVDGCPIVIDDDDNARLVSLLRRGIRREPLECRAYCVMPNHFHAILEGPMEGVSKAMHWVNGIYAHEFNERHERTGHLFQSRFRARVIRDDEHLGNACAYVWNNPVRAGLCREAHEWAWSGALLRGRARVASHGAIPATAGARTVS
jgi:REP element-mobilizing transposase RayT